MESKLGKILRSKMEREREAALLALYGGLGRGVDRAGDQLHGFSVKFSEVDCLLTLKAVFPAGWMISFVGAEDLPGALVKATRDAGRDNLTWRPDVFRNESLLEEEE